MTVSDLLPITKVYNIAAQVKETIHYVNDPPAANLYKASRKLQLRWRQIASEDPRLMESLQKLTWTTNLTVTTPLPLENAGLNRFCSPDELLGLLRQSLVSYPESSAMVEDTLSAFEQVLPLAITGLGAEVCKLARQYNRVAIITGRQWLNSSVQEYIQSVTGRSDIKLLRTSDLRGHEIYDAIIITSPPRWIEPQIRHAIRARRREIVTLSIFHRDAEQLSVLPDHWNPILSSRRLGLATKTAPQLSEELETDDLVSGEAEGLELALVLARDQTPADEASRAGNFTPLGDAEAFQLANGSVVLLSADGRTWIAEQDGTEFHVDQRSAKDIEPGDFVILRTRRDRDLIAEIADKALGPDATVLRKAQKGWKKALRLKVNQRGLSGVAQDLDTLGLGSMATPMNVRRWTSDGFIRNQKYENWLVIMTYLSFEATAESLWTEMDRINDAHRQAGYTISKVIKQKLEALSIKTIRDCMELPRIPELGDERLTLYLVQDRLGRVPNVRFTDMNKAVKW